MTTSMDTKTTDQDTTWTDADLQVELDELRREARIKGAQSAASRSVHRVGPTPAASITFTAAEIDALMTVLMGPNNTQASEERWHREMEAAGVPSDLLHRGFCKVFEADQVTNG